jgi:uncharacterized metal-binding protein YceD (DUF177 family)
VNTLAPEFSRPVPLVRLGHDPYRQQIEATREEREKLARRFGLLALDRLVATVVLSRQDGMSILLEASFEAEFVQECVVSLEPVRSGVRQNFSLLYGPAAAEERDIAIALDSEEITFEPITGEAIDIGEAVAQELSLALPAFPRDPNATITAEATESAERPLAGLARLRVAGDERC